MNWHCCVTSPICLFFAKLTLSRLFQGRVDLLSVKAARRSDPPNNPSGGKLVATLVRNGSVKVMNSPAFRETRPLWLLNREKRPFEK
ncbi:hypothetical protein NPIL_510121 [Nephila pilipes]|uniref:Secreted protein n=1 Tax=Nephila pilipes TaxID=299642 RepID=A0A8X6PL54_NEPPI|nr:hypothetical protein NPIL_510121 [Nephila pilipes]